MIFSGTFETCTGLLRTHMHAGVMLNHTQAHAMNACARHAHTQNTLAYICDIGGVRQCTLMQDKSQVEEEVAPTKSGKRAGKKATAEPAAKKAKA